VNELKGQKEKKKKREKKEAAASLRRFYAAEKKGIDQFPKNKLSECRTTTFLFKKEEKTEKIRGRFQKGERGGGTTTSGWCCSGREKEGEEKELSGRLRRLQHGQRLTIG